MSIEKMLRFFVIFFSCVSLAFALPVNDEAKWEKNSPHSALRIDHQILQNFINQYIHTNPNGVNWVSYSKVTEQDKQQLKKYIVYLSKLPIGNYNRDEQLAFWINLYNALTLQVVLEHFPVKSIKKINLNPNFILRFFYPGPWDAKLITVDSTPLTLNDIEHKIIRPIWHDPRIHYGLNCASIGCPNFQLQVYTGKNIQALLNKAAKDYVNNPRGVSIQNNNLIASKIYQWYQADFGGNEQAVIDHLKQYAQPELKQKLDPFTNIYDYQYDWSLNGD